MRLTNSKPQPFSYPINARWTKLSPALHFFLFEKPFHSDICHNMEENTIRVMRTSMFLKEICSQKLDLFDQKYSKNSKKRKKKRSSYEI